MSPEDELPTLNQHTYVRLTVLSWWENLPLVLLAGGVFTLLCVPSFVLFWFGLFAPAAFVGAFTIPPAWTALLTQLAKIAEGVKTNIGVIFRAFPRYWTRSAGLGLMLAFPVYVAILTMPALAQDHVPIIVWVGLGADGMVFLFVFTLSLYVLPLFVLHDVSFRLGMYNAVILASRHVLNTVGLLSMGVLSGLMFFWPAFWGLFIVNNCRMLEEQERSKDDG